MIRTFATAVLIVFGLMLLIAFVEEYDAQKLELMRAEAAR